MKRIIQTKQSLMGLRFVLSILVISCCMFSTKSYGGSLMKPSYLYKTEETAELKPQELKLNGGLFSGGHSSISLFPVTQDNSIGTNDMHNAITMISFPKGRISFDKHFKNAVGDIGGGGQYLPIISKDLIGFGQTRAFALYDFKKKIHREYSITTSLAKSIEKVAIADAKQRHFIFEIELGTNDPWKNSYTLQLIDLSGEKAKLIKEIPKEKGVIWSVVGDNIFLNYYDDMMLKIIDMNLEPAQHPLADLIRQNKGKLSFLVINAHHSLPFAILSGGKYGSVFISWGKDRDNTPHMLNDDATHISFSPDGKWVTFKRFIDLNTSKTYLMPVSEKYPHYLGSPIQIFNKYFNDNKSAWTTNPISFVGSRGEVIYRWDLENRDFPEKGKMSFHDYIVQEDLKKLTKEKRQGLGK